MHLQADCTESIPLHEDDTATIRVAGTRITLDILAHAWADGATPEQIVDTYPSLTLPDVYAVVTWMLRHPDELSEYLARRQKQADEVRQLIEKTWPPEEFRAKLRARAQSKKSG